MAVQYSDLPGLMECRIVRDTVRLALRLYGLRAAIDTFFSIAGQYDLDVNCGEPLDLEIYCGNEEEMWPLYEQKGWLKRK